MKIPETPANVGAYYGNEETGQWQPANGVIVDVGVGGSGDAGALYPPPRHTQHPEQGYVMAGGYYGGGGGGGTHDDFEDYMWMENEDEFDKQVMQQLEEEALMEQCIEAMLQDEQRERSRPRHNGQAGSHNGASSLSLEERLARSTLNPLAAEFVPTFTAQHTTTEVVEVDDPPAVVSAADDAPEVVRCTETSAAAAAESPARAQETQDKARGDKKANNKTDVKKHKQAPAAKGEHKVATKKETKKDTKSIKSEVSIEESETQDTPVPVVETKVRTSQDTPIPVVETKVSPASEAPADAPSAGPKPINYAAAAKANKPKKSSPPPAAEKALPAPPPAGKGVATSKDKPKASDKATGKTAEKPRKNSTK